MLLFFLFEKWENWGAFLPPFPFLKINEVSLSPHTAFSGARTHHTFPYIRKKRGWMHKISAPATQIERRGRDFSFLPFSHTPHFPLKNSRKKKKSWKVHFPFFSRRVGWGNGGEWLTFPEFYRRGGRKKVRVKSNIFRGKSRKKEKKSFACLCGARDRPRSGRT